MHSPDVINKPVKIRPLVVICLVTALLGFVPLIIFVFEESYFYNGNLDDILGIISLLISPVVALISFITGLVALFKHPTKKEKIVIILGLIIASLTLFFVIAFWCVLPDTFGDL
jgi:cobalamin biosynthesis protein CobD/CbiB